MRLTCPNCGARYEIDDALIPSEGRDVQCSNCSTNWFQSGPVVATPRAETPPPVEQPNSPDTSAPPRRALDPSLRALLREEAEREERLRREEAETLERQDEMALQDPTPAATPIARGKDRLDLLPDIEEINASLTPQQPTAPQKTTPEEVTAAKSAPSPDHARRKGRNAGLLLSLSLGLAAILIYGNAAALSEAMPELAPYLARYAAAVDGLRDIILDWLRATLPRLQAQIAEWIAAFTQ
ncbi:zinc-ribbon domain-containing protein [Rhodobacteraceae bacterium XHP0102]|nr:zinc-ribbon domain-containing protein [Rhodobacteraceae bacterium XHP0102]